MNHIELMTDALDQLSRMKPWVEGRSVEHELELNKTVINHAAEIARAAKENDEEAFGKAIRGDDFQYT